MRKSLSILAVCTLFAATSAQAIGAVSVGGRASVSVARSAPAPVRAVTVTPPRPAVMPTAPTRPATPAPHLSSPSASTGQPITTNPVHVMPHVNLQCSDDRKRANKASGKKDCD